MGADIFVSSESITCGSAADLVQALRQQGLSVNHSPPWGQEEKWSMPWNKDWDSWYGPNLLRSMTEASLIVLIVSQRWQSSTWMLAECEAATKARNQVDYPKVLVWNPKVTPITNLNYVRHLGEELPLSLDKVLGILIDKLDHLPHRLKDLDQRR